MSRVFVGMSGGVDSSLSAALLKEQGHDVVGVYMKNWTRDLPGMKCPWAEDLADAKRVAVQLGVDFRVFDFEKEYRHKVVDYMIEEYKLGRTPNPDIMCNQEVKFKLFLETALEQGAEKIATGHYARVGGCDLSTKSSEAIRAASQSGHASSETRAADVSEDLSADRAPSPSFAEAASRRVSLAYAAGETRAADVSANNNGGTRLLRAKDEGKDQTYFLYRAQSPALAQTLFPLGGFLKSEVREMAKERGLYTANKKESMGICFVGQIGIREFLSQYVDTKPGDIVDKQTGKIVGRHDGAIFYTLGQRHGLDVGGGLPYYVVGKDMSQNVVYVSQNINDENIWRRQVDLESIHWICDIPETGKTLQVRIRHRAPLIDCVLNGSTLTLSEPQRAVTPGQSAVLYDGEVCLGGGIVI